MADLTYPGFSGYSLEDEDEEEKRRQRLQAMQALQMPQRDPSMEAPGAATPPPYARGSSLSSLISPRDPEMDMRWRGAEQQALERSGYQGGQEYGAGEAVRDFAPMAIGGVLDGLLNKGRGLGAIVGGGMQANQLEETRRQKQAQAAGDFALSARNQRETQSRGALSAATEERQQASFDLLNNPENPQAQAYAQKLITAGVPPEMVEGMTLREMQGSRAAFTPYFRHGAADLTNADAANRAGGVKRAQYGAQDEHFPTELEQQTTLAGDKAAAGEAARTDVQVLNAPRTNKVAGEKAGIVAREGRIGTQQGNLASGQIMSADELGKELGGLGISVTNPQQLQSALSSPQHASKVIVQARGYARARAAITNADHEKQLFVDAVKAGDPVAAANARATYNNHKDEYAAAMMDLTDVHTEGAKHEYKEQVPSVMNPVLTMDTIYAQIEAAAGSGLGVYGMAPKTPELQDPLLKGPGKHAAPLPNQVGANPPMPRPSVPLKSPTGDPRTDPLTDVNPGGDALGVKPTPKIPIGPGQARGGAAGPPPSAAGVVGGMTFRPSGMADGSVYVTDQATGETKRVRHEQAMSAGWDGR